MMNTNFVQSYSFQIPFFSICRVPHRKEIESVTLYGVLFSIFPFWQRRPTFRPVKVNQQSQQSKNGSGEHNFTLPHRTHRTI